MEQIIGGEKFEEGVGSSFEYQLQKLMEKNGVTCSAVYFHKAGEMFNRVEAVYLGRPDVDWILTAFELLAQEAKRRHEQGGLSSGVEAFPDADPDAVKAMKAQGIDVQ